MVIEQSLCTKICFCARFEYVWWVLSQSVAHSVSHGCNLVYTKIALSICTKCTIVVSTLPVLSPGIAYAVHNVYCKFHINSKYSEQLPFNQKLFIRKTSRAAQARCRKSGWKRGSGVWVFEEGVKPKIIQYTVLSLGRHYRKEIRISHPEEQFIFRETFHSVQFSKYI